MKRFPAGHRPSFARFAPALLALAGCQAAPPPGVVAVPRNGTPTDQIRVIVTLAEKADLGSIAHADRYLRRAAVSRALREKADATQAPVRALLEENGGTRVVALPVINGIAVTLPETSIPDVLRHPAVESVALDRALTAPAVTAGSASAPEWNLSSIRATELWKLGFKGAGVVVANMDTGVDGNHLDLSGRWRGGANSWFDPFKETLAPYDAIGHGTQTMGILVGGDAGGTSIGVAPEAKWIAAKIYDDAGKTTVSIIHQAFQWLLDPDGNPDTPDAPDVVNASWGIGSANACDLTFERDLEALGAAEIAIVFAAGNSGPQALSSLSPANSAHAFSAGAVDGASDVATSSSRGPSACTGGVFPDVVAPGVNVRTSDLSLGGAPQYAVVSGTSYAAPHVAGAAALLFGAVSGLTVSRLDDALRGSARNLGPAGPDDEYGYGMLDAFEAYARLAPQTPLTFLTRSLPSAQAGADYRQVLQASGAVAPYSWKVISGSLPPGIELNATTGFVAGIPDMPGLFRFTVQVEDASGNAARQDLSIDVLRGCGR